MGNLEPVTASNATEALAYLARRPYENVYVSWLIASDQTGPGAAFVWRGAHGAVGGVCYFGAQIVPCGDTFEAIDAFALAAKRARSVRMIVGPRADVERFWEGTKTWMRAPRTVRESQPVYVLAHGNLRLAPNEDADVGRATLAELDEIIPNSARMIAGEIGGDARRTSAEFRRRTARIIEAGWWWRYRVGGALAFMCNVGSISPETAQLQGVWSPPEMRGKGYATVGMAAICAQLLVEHPTLSLYVNDFNVSAVALYERLGFVRAGEFRTLIFA